MNSTLLIDNYDSFTYNLYALIEEASGRPPIVVRNDQMDWDSVRSLNIGRIVISPGPGRPQRNADLGLSAEAILRSDLPILGVCLGHQAIGHLFGARVSLAREPVHGRVCEVTHLGVDMFAGLPSPFRAVRYHSLAVDNLPKELQPTAWAEDGTLMALRHRHRPLWGLQFHPESICTEHGAKLLSRFFDLTRVQRQTSTARDRSIARSTDNAATHVNRLKLHAVSLSPTIDPALAFTALYGKADVSFWLDSSLNGGESGRFSYMGDACGPNAEVIRYRASSDTVEITRSDGQTSLRHDLLAYLEEQLALQGDISVGDVPCNFTCGYVGFFGYELKDTLRGQRPNPATTPDACWVFADRIVAFDHHTGQTWLLCLDSEAGLAPENEEWLSRTTRILLNFQAADPARPKSHEGAARIHELHWGHAPGEYRQLIRRAQQLIREGETYEVCLTNQITGTCTLDPLATYLALRSISPAPYSAFLKIDSLAVLCSSPELFLKVSEDGAVHSKPIKGTARRSASIAEDQRRAEDLAASVKNRAENLMIVDLLRNDLNRVCRTGSVHVPKLFSVETYASVHHLVSTISGTLRPDATAIDCVRAMFPGGSMTGAPKERTLAILDELEGRPRGVYSGSLGFLSVSRRAELNIVIRTLVLNGSELTIGTGGAITALSDPDEEYAEMVLKVRALMRTLKECGAAYAYEDFLSCADENDRRGPPDGHRASSSVSANAHQLSGSDLPGEEMTS